MFLYYSADQMIKFIHGQPVLNIFCLLTSLFISSQKLHSVFQNKVKRNSGNADTLMKDICNYGKEENRK